MPRVFPWSDARLAGVVGRPGIPRHLVEAIGRRLETEGLTGNDASEHDQFRVSDVAPEAELDGPPSSYRVAGSRERAVCIEAANARTALAAGFDELRLWRRGDRAVAYEVTFPRWSSHARTQLVAAAVAGIAGLVLPVVTRMVPLRVLAFYAAFLLVVVALFPRARAAAHRRRLQRLVEALVDDELRRGAARVAMLAEVEADLRGGEPEDARRPDEQEQAPSDDDDAEGPQLRSGRAQLR